MLFSTKVSDCTSCVAHEYFSFYHFKHDNFTELPYEMACKHLTKIIFVNVVFFIINMLQMKIKSMYFVLCALFCIFLLLYSLKSVNLQLRVRIECEILRSFLTRCTAKTADMS